MVSSRVVRRDYDTYGSLPSLFSNLQIFGIQLRVMQCLKRIISFRASSFKFLIYMVLRALYGTELGAHDAFSHDSNHDKEHARRPTATVAAFDRLLSASETEREDDEEDDGMSLVTPGMDQGRAWNRRRRVRSRLWRAEARRLPRFIQVSHSDGLL